MFKFTFAQWRQLGLTSGLAANSLVNKLFSDNSENIYAVVGFQNSLLLYLNTSEKDSDIYICRKKL